MLNEKINQLFDIIRSIFICLEKNALVLKFKNQILTLFLSFSNHPYAFSYNVITKFVLTNIFKIFPNLIHLRFLRSSKMDVGYMSIDSDIPICSSSFLRELHVTVSSLTECLYLLDGRLNQLDSFYVNIVTIYRIPPNIDMKV